MGTDGYDWGSRGSAEASGYGFDYEGDGFADQTLDFSSPASGSDAQYSFASPFSNDTAYNSSPWSDEDTEVDAASRFGSLESALGPGVSIPNIWIWIGRPGPVSPYSRDPQDIGSGAEGDSEATPIAWPAFSPGSNQATVRRRLRLYNQEAQMKSRMKAKKENSEKEETTQKTSDERICLDSELQTLSDLRDALMEEVMRHAECDDTEIQGYLSMNGSEDGRRSEG
ncbi:hypothetical protein QBC47DRAFT_358556 [Echria macrotheca]|uniref:BZIP domain-containing protein n=1 Tax=Echria macrotheca TaxID=438768 RepID=A0AAJ0BI67_9PEZI|nr:hypothetical protein QBC47DRAFT_358556 [Echria macrotheca]